MVKKGKSVKGITVEGFSVEGCFKPANFGAVIEFCLHHDADVSEYGYGQASYLHFVDENGRIHCCLVNGNSRVAPSKLQFLEWNQ